MKATVYLSILALVWLAGCAAQQTTVATTTTTRQVTREPPQRIPIQPHTLPPEIWAAKSAIIGKDSP
ncbi:MAG: hypothetical protein ACJ8LL_05715 [Candidatus Udaeobacter sp.]